MNTASPQGSEAKSSRGLWLTVEFSGAKQTHPKGATLRELRLNVNI